MFYSKVPLYHIDYFKISHFLAIPKKKVLTLEEERAYTKTVSLFRRPFYLSGLILGNFTLVLVSETRGLQGLILVSLKLVYSNRLYFMEYFNRNRLFFMDYFNRFVLVISYMSVMLQALLPVHFCLYLYNLMYQFKSSGM